MTKRALLLTVLFLSCWTLLARASRPGIVPSHEPLGNLPTQIGGWTGYPAPQLDTRVLAILGADDHVNRVYRNDSGAFLGLYVGYHRAQTQGDSIHSPMNCLPGAGWIPVHTSQTDIAASSGPKTVNRVIVQKAEERQLVLYWYQSQGRTVASEYASKTYLFLDALRSRRTDAALVRLVSPITTDAKEEGALSAAKQFAEALLPLLARHIPD